MTLSVWLYTRPLLSCFWSTKATFAWVWTINEPHLPYKTGLDVMQSYPLCRTRFGQYQASSAALGWPGDGDCYIMHRMQLGGSKVSRDSSKACTLIIITYLWRIIPLCFGTMTLHIKLCTFHWHDLMSHRSNYIPLGRGHLNNRLYSTTTNNK